MAKLDKILSMTDQSIQFWLRTVEPQDVMSGLVGASLEVRERIMANMAPRAKVVLRDYLESHEDLSARIVEASLSRLESALNLVR